MIPTTAIARSVTAATMLGLLLTGVASVSAVPDPAGPRQGGSTSSDQKGCPLERIERQLVRCDSLTGAGAPAPSWVPEQPAR
jgi:hypothetical protein